MTEVTRRPGTVEDLKLFTGTAQHENFGRMAELVSTRRMALSSAPIDWELGEAARIPDAFEFEGRTRSATRFLAETDTCALLVVHRGRIRVEDYSLTGGPHVPWMSMSVAKSFVSALVVLGQDVGSSGLVLT
jgi:hypothetical protein